MDMVKPRGRGPLSPRVRIPIHAPPEDYFVAFAPLGNHFRNEFWWILKVHINGHYDLAFCRLQTCSESCFLTKITA